MTNYILILQNLKTLLADCSVTCVPTLTRFTDGLFSHLEQMNKTESICTFYSLIIK